MNLLASISTYIFILIHLTTLSLAVPFPAKVVVGQELYQSLSGGIMQRRDAPYKITGEDCVQKRSGGIKFCAMGHYLCQSRSKEAETEGARMWEAIDDPEQEKKCPQKGWTGNSDIVRIKTK
ncbi:hypothetical protein MCOR02_007743 [Pyricularia oryzae]|uniref:Secreted protein n=2 Tax=Pyricularia TaxID=48558 RepID=A0ABQ8NCV4_PYRGI|nr:hypothetical protein MCOR02_007743 [Pyricularia oryzae]KAI6295029.1 hypothetical protein MCOR33_007977 [Pyricularia grisea]KAI6284732.1 hypothetical protein MCOR26_001855 [Pyricularia oryzae]KAI6343621.1 hypothetical protein MCOR28_004707 [Pyricularia oryzae]KAI6391873.1 hypothetical protein MCOR23_008769 [Pyricularia oryzae]